MPRLSDSVVRMTELPKKDTTCVASTVLPGGGDLYATSFYSDEFVSVVSSPKASLHAKTAIDLTSDTVRWAYETVRQRPSYWIDKRQLVARIVRTVNLTIWQKRRETGFHEGLIAQCLFVIMTESRYFIGAVGDATVFLIARGTVLNLRSSISKGWNARLGVQRLGVKPDIIRGNLKHGDYLLVVPDIYASYVATLAQECVRPLHAKTDVHALLGLVKAYMVKQSGGLGGAIAIVARLT